MHPTRPTDRPVSGTTASTGTTGTTGTTVQIGSVEEAESAPPETAAERPVAVVLGGSRGLGLLIARELLARGHRVVVAARDGDELERATATLSDWGPVSTQRCDVRDRHEVGELVGRVEHTVGP